MNSMEWLENHWRKMIDVVVKEALENKDGFGQITQEEAKQAMMNCGGDAKVAVEVVIDKRKAQVGILSVYSVYD